MPAEGNRLYLYEALELRAEYDARLKTLRDCLPEARKNRDRLGIYGNDQPPASLSVQPKGLRLHDRTGDLPPGTLRWPPLAAYA